MVTARFQRKRIQRRKAFDKKVKALTRLEWLSPRARKDAKALYSSFLSKGPREHLGDLKMSFKILKRSTEKSERIQELEEISKKKDCHDWLLKVGDWCAVLLGHVRGHEDGAPFRRQEIAEFVKYRKAQGVPELQANQHAEKSAKWRVFAGQVQEFWPRVQIEIAQVQAWRESGCDHQATPDTPFLVKLNRVLDGSDGVNQQSGPQKITHKLFIKTMECYNERNQFAHYQNRTSL